MAHPWAKLPPFINHAIEDAARHGRESEPDHEVGDLQTLVRNLAVQMTPDQIERVAAGWQPWDAIETDPEPAVPTTPTPPARRRSGPRTRR